MWLYQFNSIPPVLQLVLSIPVLIFTTCLLTWIITSINFSRSIAKFKARSSGKQSTADTTPLPPPVLPYVIPWLGSALMFLNQNPGSNWRALRAKLAATNSGVQVCTILLAGKKAHVIHSAGALQALFKTKNVSKEMFNHRLGIQTLGTSERDTNLMWPPASASLNGEKDKKTSMEAVNHEFLLSSTAVNNMTNTFMEHFRRELEQADFGDEWTSVDLLSWLRNVMFRASTTAAMGTHILEMNPNLPEEFWEYDSGFLERFYGVPRLVKPSIYTSLEKLVDKTQVWVEDVLARHRGEAPDEPEWEPLLGSKIVRARHRFYTRIGLSARGKAAFDLGFLFGLSANAVPLMGWLLAHLVSPVTPPDVLGRIQGEVEKSRTSKGAIDIAKLTTQPLTNSALHETMRQYVDSLVTRELTADLNLDGYLLHKNDLVMAPSSLSQQDPQFWERDGQPSAEVWYAERFLSQDTKTGKPVFSTGWASGKFFPFGGGTDGCPGRVFAKQEILGAMASLLLHFEIQFEEYLGKDHRGQVVGLGKGEAGFPRVKQQYAGNGTLSMDGDIRVRMRRR